MPSCHSKHMNNSRVVMKDMATSAAPTMISSALQMSELPPYEDRASLFRVPLEHRVLSLVYLLIVQNRTGPHDAFSPSPPSLVLGA